MVACVVLGAGATAFWLAGKREELRVTFAEASTNNSYVAWFTVTNSSTRSFTYAPYVAERLAGSWTNKSKSFWGTTPTLDAHRARHYQTSSYSTNRWRVEITYQEIRPPSWVTRTQLHLSRYAANHRWPRLSRFLQPGDRWEHTCGPEMLGNKPAPPERK
jgi:hypothetical protein